MKRLAAALIAAVVLASSAASARSTPPVVARISLEDIVKRVSQENYWIKENALRVYQAKESVTVARWNLLPKLNVWEILGIVFSPGSFAGFIDDIAPFVVPANWFRIQEEKHLALSQQEAYHALWANELMTAKGLYVGLLTDIELKKSIEETRKEIKRVQLIAEAREVLGELPVGNSRTLELRYLALEEDLHRLQLVINQEKRELSFVLGYPTDTELELKSIPMPDFNKLEDLKSDEFQFRVLSSSPELKQYHHLIQAIEFLPEELRYSILGASTANHGVAGGVFDGLPVQNGLGLGNPAAMRISKAQKLLLETQKKGVEETLKRQLKSVVDTYNLDLEHYVDHKKRAEISKVHLAAINERFDLGGDAVEVLQLIDASQNYIQATTALLRIQYGFLTHEDKLARLIFHGDYAVAPPQLEELPEEDKK